MCTKKYKNQAGFTLVELLIATTVFSVILLVACSAIIQIGRIYYKGITTARTQEVNRSLNEDIARSIQFEKYTSVRSGGSALSVGAFCVGLTRYTYTLDKPVSSTQRALWIDRITNDSTCEPADLTTSPPTGPNPLYDASYEGRELLAQNMRLLDFSIIDEDKTAGTFKIVSKVAYGDSDLLDHYTDNSVRIAAIAVKDARCKTTRGSNFCAVAQLDTTVKSRIN